MGITEHKKKPKKAEALVEGQSPPQELEEGPRSGQYLLEQYKFINTSYIIYLFKVQTLLGIIHSKY